MPRSRQRTCRASRNRSATRQVRTLAQSGYVVSMGFLVVSARRWCLATACLAMAMAGWAPQATAPLPGCEGSFWLDLWNEGVTGGSSPTHQYDKKDFGAFVVWDGSVDYYQKVYPDTGDPDYPIPPDTFYAKWLELGGSTGVAGIVATRPILMPAGNVPVSVLLGGSREVDGGTDVVDVFIWPGPPGGGLPAPYASFTLDPMDPLEWHTVMVPLASETRLSVAVRQQNPTTTDGQGARFESVAGGICILKGLDFTWSLCGSAVTFAGIGPATRWTWEFGDGGTADGSSTSHQYAGAGTYTVTMTGRDDSGTFATVTKDIVVDGSCSGGAGRGTQVRPQGKGPAWQPPQDGIDPALAGSDLDGDGIPDRDDSCPRGMRPAVAWEAATADACVEGVGTPDGPGAQQEAEECTEPVLATELCSAEPGACTMCPSQQLQAAAPDRERTAAFLPAANERASGGTQGTFVVLLLAGAAIGLAFLRRRAAA